MTQMDWIKLLMIGSIVVTVVFGALSIYNLFIAERNLRSIGRKR